MGFQLTDTEVEEKFKHLKLKFSRYWKYEFFFEGEVDNYRVIVSQGGDPDDIYRYEVRSDTELQFESPYAWTSVQVLDLNTNEQIFYH